VLVMAVVIRWFAAMVFVSRLFSVVICRLKFCVVVIGVLSGSITVVLVDDWKTCTSSLSPSLSLSLSSSLPFSLSSSSSLSLSLSLMSLSLSWLSLSLKVSSKTSSSFGSVGNCDGGCVGVGFV